MADRRINYCISCLTNIYATSCDDDDDHDDDVYVCESLVTNTYDTSILHVTNQYVK